MKFYVVKEQPCPVSRRSDTSVQTFSLDTKISASDEAGTGTGSKYQKFEAAFKKRFPSNCNPEKLEPLTVEFLNLKNKGPGKWDIFLRGSVLKQLHQLLYHGNDNVTLEIALQLTCQHVLDKTIKTLHVKGLNAVKGRKGVVDLACYKVKNVEVTFPPKYSTWRMTVEVTGTDFMSAEDVLPVGVGVANRIFKNRNFCDFELISADGTGVKCHKAFLSAHSPVFTNLLLGGHFEGAQENKMKMPGMSTRSLNAFLAFIYCDEIEEALTYSDVALELLKASDMYDMPKLGKAMSTILKEKSERWYSVEGALKLLDFIRNCYRKEERESLMQKNVMNILAIKRDKLKESTLYTEMFPTAVSREMFERLLNERLPKPDNPVVDNTSVTKGSVRSSTASWDYLTARPQRSCPRRRLKSTPGPLTQDPTIILID